MGGPSGRNIRTSIELTTWTHPWNIGCQSGFEWEGAETQSHIHLIMTSTPERININKLHRRTTLHTYLHSALAVRVERGAAGKADVSPFTPGCPPRVLHQPVIASGGVRAVAHTSHTVVEASGLRACAALGRHHTAGVDCTAVR